MTIVEIAQPITAPPHLVWVCLTHPESVRQWFGPHMALDARPGGGFREVWRDRAREVVTSGRVLDFDPPNRLAMSWADDDWEVTTTVVLTLEASAGGTCLRLVHSGWDALGEVGKALAEAHRTGWNMHLANLKVHAEARASSGPALEARVER